MTIPDISETRGSIPRVQHIAYFQDVLRGIAEGETFDGLRVRLRQVAAEIGAARMAALSHPVSTTPTPFGIRRPMPLVN